MVDLLFSSLSSIFLSLCPPGFETISFLSRILSALMHVEEHHRKQIIVLKLYSKTIWIKDITGRLEMKVCGLWIFLFLKKSILIKLFVNILFTIFSLHAEIYFIIIFCVSFSALVLCSQAFCHRSSVLTVLFSLLGDGFGFFFSSVSVIYCELHFMIIFLLRPHNR